MLKLKEFRKNKGLTQGQLANILDITQDTISTYERGTREPNIEMLKKIAVVLDVTVDDLVNFREEYEKLHKELEDKIQEKEKEPKS